ncbi:hypothetical protein PPL_00720 [Heterostelium album PN500]|uniref:Protein kinase domain-containing protein n=1 Tax=Heterostelium pallidum (strain ATCC 26659 / Pp 5 / PN500) TaxID=670386 RepID=D3AX89_HETP5|nr:hypothetical protein PPL_00720 [Heterostelium album PN500]EFA86158.1 hypothetical protein PPL_00720 [Heterostelium album PN500]|eukprot:XP_020438263.1 hypothetical protein PPL_00720 [Heterostelium album PN500]
MNSYKYSYISYTTLLECNISASNNDNDNEKKNDNNNNNIKIKNNIDSDLFVIISGSKQGLKYPDTLECVHIPVGQETNLRLDTQTFEDLTFKIFRTFDNTLVFEPITLQHRLYSIEIRSNPNDDPNQIVPTPFTAIAENKSYKLYHLSNVDYYYYVSHYKTIENTKYFLVINGKDNTLYLLKKYNYKDSPSLEVSVKNELKYWEQAKNYLKSQEIDSFMGFYHDERKSKYIIITEFENMNILQFYEFYQSYNNFRFVHKKNEYIPEPTVWSLIEQFLNILHALESLNIAHCNINESTVFVKRNNQISIQNFEYSVDTSVKTKSLFDLGSDDDFSNQNNDNSTDQINIKVSDGKVDILGFWKIFKKLFSLIYLDKESYSSELLVLVEGIQSGKTEPKITDLQSIPIEPNTLPDGILDVVFGYLYNQPFKLGALPNSITSIKFGEDFNQPLPEGVLPVSLENLVFGDNFNQPLKPRELPPFVQNLKFGRNFNQPIVEKNTLPQSLRSLKFGENFSQRLANLPEDLNQLELGEEYNLQMAELPESIKTLRGVSGQLNEWVRIPDSVTSLTFGRHFNQPILKGMLPVSLIYLEFGYHFNSTIHPHSLPDRLEVLNFGYCFNQPIDILPANLVKMKLGDSFNQHITEVLPNTIKSLSFGSKYVKTLPTLPDSLQRLHLGNKYPHQIKSSVLPQNLNSLTKGDKEYSKYIQAFKKNDIDYHFPVDNSEEEFKVLELSINNTDYDLIIFIKSHIKKNRITSTNLYLFNRNSLHNIYILDPAGDGFISQISIIKFTDKILISNIFDFPKLEPCRITLSVKDSFSFGIYNQNKTHLKFPVDQILSSDELKYLTKLYWNEKNFYNVFQFRAGSNTSHLLMDVNSHQLFVCKSLKLQPNTSIQQFLLEIKALQSLKGNSHFVQYESHVHIPEKNKLIIMTKYCNGGDLSLIHKSMSNWNMMVSNQVLKNKRSFYFSEENLWSYAKQLAIILYHMRAANGGILHNDIKLANLLLENNKLVVADFGCSKFLQPVDLSDLYNDNHISFENLSTLEENTTPTSNTSCERKTLPSVESISKANGCSRGTIYYQAPETINRIREMRQYGIASELYSIGSVLHNLTSLQNKSYRTMFETDKTDVHISKIVYSGQLIRLIKRLLSIKPEERGTLEEFYNSSQTNLATPPMNQKSKKKRNNFKFDKYLMLMKKQIGDTQIGPYHIQLC